MNAKPKAGLTAWLVSLVVAAVVPLLLFAGATVFRISKDSQAARDRGQADTARALALAVDGEVRSWKAALTALAGSRTLRDGRLAKFYEEAQGVAAPHGGWVVLTVSSGQQLINTLRPYGSPLPKTSSPETIDAIFAHGKPLVSDVFYGKVAQGYLIALAVPVMREGKVVNCLTLNFYPQRLTQLLQSQQLPPSWIVGITDRQHHVVARSWDIEQRVGKPVAPWLATALAAADRGIVTGLLTDGRPGQVAFQRLQEVPWDVVLAVPVAELPSNRPLMLFILGGALVGAGAVGAALYIGRKITAPVARLAAASEQVLRGEAVDLGAPSTIQEVRELQEALGDASAAVQGYYQERERAAIAAETAKVATAAEQALRESEGRLRLFIENAPAAIAMFDREMRYLAVSHRWMSDYGLGDRDLVGQSHYAVFPDIPDAWKAVHQRGLAGEVVQSPEDRFERMDGTVQWLRWEVRPWRADDGSVGGIILFTEDITERKRAEAAIQRLAAIVESSDDAIIGKDLTGTILSWNAGAERLYGYAAAEVLGRHISLLAPPDCQDEWLSLFERVLRGEGITHHETVRLMKLGARLHVSLSLSPIRDATGAIVGVSTIARDITDRKRAEAALQQAHTLLEQRVEERTAELSAANQALAHRSDQLRDLASELTLAEQRERRRLAALLHDEHQQLLVAARLRVNQLERAESPMLQGAAREITAILTEAIEHARSLTRELSPPIRLTGGLGAAVDWLADWMEAKHHLKVEAQTDDTAIPATEELAVLLFQALRELLFNIVKHTTVQTAQVEIVRSDGQLRLSVSDAGGGFNPAEFRVEGGPGGGFGLFSIRQRLELFGGRLDIDSAYGQGSRFTLWAPARPDPAGRPATPSVPLRSVSAKNASSPAAGVPAPAKIRVLVVDDHAVVREALAGMLGQEPDIQIVGEAWDGKLAVELVRQLRPDVVTMDINMPVMDGVKATQAIHAEFPAVRVIGLSMFDEAGQARVMREAGAAEYLSKSGPSEALIAAIRACVTRK